MNTVGNAPKDTTARGGVESLETTTYTKTETDNLLSGKANSSHTHDDRYYTETEVDTLNTNMMKSATRLGSIHLELKSGSTTDVTGTISLNDTPSNYRFIYITHGYYEIGFPSYGSILIPVAIIPLALEHYNTTGGVKDNGVEYIHVEKFNANATQIYVSIANCFLAGATNCYAAAYGIK